jgi:4-oxalomesaconate tautomerase
MNRIPVIYMRGGTSKGPFFDLRDLPDNNEEMSRVLLRIMGSPDTKQIDGIGGGTFVTSKVVMVRPSEKPGIDVEYLFAQVFIDQAIVDTKPTCGNMMSGVAPFAVEKGWVTPEDDITYVQVYNLNTNSTIEVKLHTPGGKLDYVNGDFSIDGVPGTGSPILMKLSRIEGGATGRLFPTGKLIDTIQGVEVTMFDAGNLMIHMSAADFGLTGNESPSFFTSNPALMKRLESIRLEIAELAGLGDVSNSVLPKIGLLSKPQQGGHIKSMYLTPKTLHPTHAVSGAICICTAARCAGTIASKELVLHEGEESHIILEHPSGKIPINVDVSGTGLDFKIHSAGTYRTARKLLEGYVYY